MKEIKIIYIIGLIVYLLFAFGSEFLYRNKLYDKSVEYEKDIDQDGFWHYFFYFWAMIFLYSSMGIGIIAILFFYPINITFSYYSIPMLLTFTMCMLKSIYSNPRPYWDIYVEKQGSEENKFLSDPTECDGGFGNPSGHALLSTYLLCLWDLFINSTRFNKLEGIKKTFIKYFSLFLSIAFMFFIMYSRIQRQIHSINQVIFGAILGISIFFTFCYILEISKITTSIFIDILDKFKFILIPIALVLFTISVIIGLNRHNNKENDYMNILHIYCDYEENEVFGKNTAFHSTIIFLLIGGYIGLLFLRYQIRKNYLNKEEIFYNWNQGRRKIVAVKIALFCFALPLILGSAVVLIPIKYYALKFIVSILFYFTYGFLSMGLLVYYGCIIFRKEELMEDDRENLLNEDEEEIKDE